MRTLTIIDGSDRLELATTGPEDDPSIDPAAIGWELKPEGLCQGDICLPLRATPTDRGRIALGDLARLLGRPVVVDGRRRVAALGTAAGVRTEQMRSLVAPGFTLPDPEGRPVSLGDFGRRKRLLLAWSSW